MYFLNTQGENLRLITPPAALPVTLEEVKAHLRVQHARDDTVLMGLITAATALIDGKSGELFLCLMPQTWAQAFDYAFPSRVELPLGPVIAIDSITYIDTEGDEQTLPSEAYEFYPTDGGDDAYVLPVWGTLWPATRCQARAVTVTYSAGYADGAVPEPIRIALLFQVARMYRDREGGDEMDKTASCLLNPYRRIGV